MIDRLARSETARLLRRLAAERITNDEFADSLPLHSEDRAIRGIDEGAWGLYDDLREYRLIGSDRINHETRNEVVRWVLFLSTGLEYEWPFRTEQDLKDAVDRSTFSAPVSATLGTIR